MLPLLRGLAKLKRLRGSALDPFGYTAERKLERHLIVEYEHDVDELLGRLTADTHALAVEIAKLPQAMRGYGHVKRKAIDAARNRKAALMAELVVVSSAERHPGAARRAQAQQRAQEEALH